MTDNKSVAYQRWASTNSNKQPAQQSDAGYYDSIYQNAIKKLGGNVNDAQHKAIVNYINLNAFGKAYDQPLWQMEPSKIDSIINNKLTVDYDEEEIFKPPEKPSVTLPEPVDQEQAVNSISDLPSAPITADKTKLPKFKFHDPNGEDYELQAVGVDKYGEYIWKRQIKGQSLRDEFVNWTTQLTTERLYKDYEAQQNSRQSAEYALKEQKNKALEAQGVTNPEEYTPTESQIQTQMGVQNVQNAISSIGRIIWTGLEIVGDSAKNIIERPIGTLSIKTGLNAVGSGWEKIEGAEKKYGVKQYELVKREAPIENITWDEAWQASRLTFDLFGRTNHNVNEFIRMYRADPGADPAELEKQFENPVADMIISAMADPYNLIDQATAANKVARGLDKATKFVAVGETAQHLDDLERVITGVERVADDVTETVAKVADDIPVQVEDVAQDTIRTIDANLPLEQQLPTAKANLGLAKKAYSDATTALKAIDPADTEAVKAAKLTQKTAKREMLNWKENYASISAKRKAEITAQELADALKNPAKKTEVPIGEVPKVKTEMEKFISHIATKVDEADASLNKYARSLKETHRMKMAEVGDTLRDTFTLLAAASDDPEELGKALVSMITLASKDKKVSYLAKWKALEVIRRHKGASTILSEGGMQTAVILRQMFTDEVGKIDIGGLAKIVEAAQTADDPLMFLAENLDKKAYAVANQILPDVYTRIDNAKKIKELQAAGKPIPSYLKRFMDGDKVDEISPFYQKFLEAHNTIQHKILLGKGGLADINGWLAGAYISVNPPTWFRNAVNNATTMAVEGANPFRTAENIDQIFSKWHSPSSASVEFTGIQNAVPSDVESNLIKKIGEINSKIESFQAKQVISHALNEAMKDQFKVIFNDLNKNLMAKGFTEAECQKIAQHIFEAADVEKGLYNFFDMDAHRVISDFIQPDEVKKLDGYIPQDELSRAVRTSNKKQAVANVKALFQKITDHGNKALKEEMVITPDNPMFDDIKYLRDIPDEMLEKADVDLIGRKVHATHGAFAEARQAITKYKQELRNAIQEIRYDLDEVAQKALDQRANSAFSILENADVEFSKLKQKQSLWQQTEGAEILRRAKAAQKAGDFDIAGQLYNEFKALNGEYWDKTGADQIKVFQDALAQAQSIMSDVKVKVNTGKLDAAIAKIDQLRDVDIDAYRVTDELYSKTTGEKIDLFQIGDELVTPNGAVKEAEKPLQDALNKILASIEKNWDNNVPTTSTPEKLEAIREFAPVAGKRLSEARAKAFQYANAVRESTLLDYRKKTAYDLAAAYLMPFQFWYSRSYVNWFKRLADRPGMTLAYVQYRKMMEKINSDMPEWYRYQINLGHMLGLPEDNPLYFQLEQMINPLNGLLGVDYNDSRKQKDAFPKLIDALGKYGPSTHTLLSWGIAAYYGIKGDKDTAEAWAGRFLPQSKTIKDFSSIMGLNQKWDLGIIKGTPGGIEIDPMLNFFFEGKDSYENKRITRKLAEMVQRGEIEPDEAARAAYDHSGEAWDLAWQYAQNDPQQSFMTRRGVTSAFADLFGTGLRGRTEEDVLNDKFFEEYNLLRTIQNNLSPSEYKQKLVQLYERYPFGEYLVLSKKNDTYRDQAWAYSVLDRIEPGKLSGYAKAAGLDSNMLDKFYDEKGRIDKWSEEDRAEFLAAISNMSVVIKIPAEATQHEFNVARVRSLQLNEYLKGKYGDNILDRINLLYDIDSTNTAKRDQYLAQNPDVQQAIAEKDENILADGILNRYYGGIDKLETYLQYQKRGKAVKLFGEDIYELITYDNLAKEKGADRDKLRADFPQIVKYYEWNADQEKKIQNTISEWGSKNLPTDAQNIINPDAKINSIGQENLAKYMQEMNTTADVDTFLAPYMVTGSESENTTSFSQTKYIKEEAEKRWNGITERIKAFENAKATSPELARQMWESDPTISMYYTYKRGIESQANQAEKGIFAPSNVQQSIIDSMSPELYRLAQDKVGGMEISKTAEKQLKRVATRLGITYNELLMYIIQ